MKKIFLVSIIFVFIFLISSCSSDFKKPEGTLFNLEMKNETTLESPSKEGNIEVHTFYYAGDYNPRRKEYSLDNLSVITDNVDISFLTNQIDKKLWGFDSSNVPLNGIVYYPNYNGRFPVVLCVHGNANPEIPSEFGYDYLGKLMASRGIIFVSIDETFLNGRIFNENDARGYLLLKHAQEILSWNNDETNPLYNKIDTENIALIGHSRGGEAVAIAAVFNKLSRYPDDGNFEFDFNLPLKAIISIAPVEGQYRPSNKRTSPDYLNHLLIHGSQDGDVYQFMGLNYFHRNYPLPGIIKSSYWIYGANHAQFNTIWGKNEDPMPSFAKNLLSFEDQLEIAKILITGFVEMSFGINPEYEKIFTDYKNTLNWLPETYYIHSYLKGDETIIADFQKNIDIETTYDNNWKINAINFDKWYENRSDIHNSFSEGPENYSVYLDWDLKSNDENDEESEIKIPEFRIIKNSEKSFYANYLAFDLLVLNIEEDYLNFSIEIKTKNETLNFILDDYYKITKTPVVNVFPLSISRRNIFKSIIIPIEKSVQIEEINFVFDRTEKGFITLDNIRIGGK